MKILIKKISFMFTQIYIKFSIYMHRMDVYVNSEHTHVVS